MQKRITEYTSPEEALAALVRRLNSYENRYNMTSAEFYTRYKYGQTVDDEDFVDWAGNYQHYTAIRQEVDS